LPSGRLGKTPSALKLPVLVSSTQPAIGRGHGPSRMSPTGAVRDRNAWQTVPAGIHVAGGTAEGAAAATGAPGRTRTAGGKMGGSSGGKSGGGGMPAGSPGGRPGGGRGGGGGGGRPGGRRAGGRRLGGWGPRAIRRRRAPVRAPGWGLSRRNVPDRPVGRRLSAY